MITLNIGWISWIFIESLNVLDITLAYDRSIDVEVKNASKVQLIYKKILLDTM